MSNKLTLAYIVASYFHKGQKYGDKEYIYHCIAVANHFENENEKITAMLHDTLEDTTVTKDQIEEWFGYEIANTIVYLTRKEGEKYKSYISRLSKNEMARKIKLADLEENMKNQNNESLMNRYLWASSFLSFLDK